MHSSCLFICEQMAKYLDGELDEAERKEVERHVAECEPCLWRLEAMRAKASRGLEPSVALEAGENTADLRDRRIGWARRLWPAAAVVSIALGLHFLVPEEAHRPGTAEDASSLADMEERAFDPLDQELRAPVASTAEATVFSDAPSDTQSRAARFAEDLGLHVGEGGEVFEGPALAVHDLLSRIARLGARVDLADSAESLPQEGLVRITLAFESEE